MQNKATQQFEIILTYILCDLWLFRYYCNHELYEIHHHKQYIRLFYLSVLRIHKSNINTKLNVKLSEKGMSWKTANVMKGSYFSTIAEKNHVFKTPNNIIYPYDHVLVSTIPNISILVCYFITLSYFNHKGLICNYLCFLSMT